MKELTYEKFLLAMKEIAKRLKELNLPIKNIYGIPNGGSVPAVYLHHLTGLPIIARPGKRTLIVDDISDTGETLLTFMPRESVTIYYHKQSIVEPDIWIYEKKDDWILFPWETKESSKNEVKDG